jgi:hypothetical protein
MVPIPTSFSHLWGDLGIRGEIRATEKRGSAGYGSNHFVGSNPTLSGWPHVLALGHRKSFHSQLSARHCVSCGPIAEAQGAFRGRGWCGSAPEEKHRALLPPW